MVSDTVVLLTPKSVKFCELILKKIKSSSKTVANYISSVWLKSVSFTQALNRNEITVNKNSKYKFFFISWGFIFYNVNKNPIITNSSLFLKVNLLI